MKGNPSNELDMNLASQVQEVLFPKSSPTCSWGCAAMKNRMAQGVGGDYFDILSKSDECEILFIGDVTGHGLHASLVMALLYGFIHNAFLRTCPCLDIVSQVNDFLLSFATRTTKLDQFFSSTLFYTIINPQKGQLSYVNACHPAPLVRRSGNIMSLPSTSPPVGFFENPEISMEQFRLEKGDRLLFYTDGIVEAENRHGEPFGTQRLEEILLQSDCNHIEFLDKLFAELEDFGAEVTPSDDSTAIIIDYHSPYCRRQANGTGVCGGE